MPSARRIRLLTLAAILTVVFVLFYSSGFSSGDGRPADFYHKTMDAMHGHVPGQAVVDSGTGKRAGHIPADRDGDGDVDDDDKKAGEDLQQRMGQVAQEAKQKANEKAPNKPDIPSRLVGVGSAADGQKKNAADVVGKDAPQKELEAASTAEVKLNGILKKGPGTLPSASTAAKLTTPAVIIFSKSYCPHSKRAKGILLEKYNIEPKPFVVELDEEPLGSELQDLLEVKTGRRTVPNVLVNGVSIGGADLIVDLDNTDKLTGKIQDLGQRRVQVSLRFGAEEVKGAAAH